MKNLKYERSKEFFALMKLVGRKEMGIQTFDDNRQRHEPSLAAIFRHLPEKIQEFIDKGAGIYWPVNPQKPLTKRGYEHTSHFSSFGLDLDGGKEENKPDPKTIKNWKTMTQKILRGLHIPPAFIIDTKNGLQPVWLFTPFPLDEQAIKQKIIEEYKILIRGFAEKT